MQCSPNVLKLKINLIGLIQLFVVTLGLCNTAECLTYKIPTKGNIIGEYRSIMADRGDTLFDIAEEFDIGVGDMLAANPDLSHKPFKSPTEVIIPAQFILPNAPKEGIVLNLAEKRLFYFHPDGETVSTYPVGIGRQGWATPLGTTEIVSKKEHPAWHPTESIRREAAMKGKPLPLVVPPGPKNPLGNYAMHLGFTGIMIHGTTSPKSVGLQSSHGCIRLYANDIDELFHLSTIGTPVRVIYEPHEED